VTLVTELTTTQELRLYVATKTEIPMKSVRDTEGYNFVRKNGSHYLCATGAISRRNSLPLLLVLPDPKPFFSRFRSYTQACTQV
jgi:hypothetical protein